MNMIQDISDYKVSKEKDNEGPAYNNGEAYYNSLDRFDSHFPLAILIVPTYLMEADQTDAGEVRVSDIFD